MKLTLGAIKNSRVPHVLGTCATDPRLVQWANAAQERLMARGRWWGTVTRAKFCVASGCLTWPREVAVIERVRLCDQPITTSGLWYQFTEFIDPNCEGCCWETDPNLIDVANSPLVADISGTGKKVKAYSTDASDDGKYIIVQGYDENNYWIRTDDGGTPIDGEKILLSTTGTVSTKKFDGGITGIIREATNYDVLLYQYDATTAAVETLLARYQPNETHPDYRRSKLINIGNGCCSNTDCANPVYTVDCIVKLQHVPVSADNDWFVIQNQSAMELAIKSIKLEEDGKDGDAEITFKKAIRELQHQLRTMTGDKLTYRITGHGSAVPDRVFKGFI